MAKENIIIPLAVASVLYLIFSKQGKAEIINKDYSEVKESDRIAKNAVDYIKMYYPLAKLTQEYHLVPAQFTIAQAALESGWGQSNVALKAKNHFGIKADKRWKGEKYGEYRKYDSIQQSFNDQAKFLNDNKRYHKAFSHVDPVNFALAVAKAGYSENPNYATIMRAMIETVQKIV